MDQGTKRKKVSYVNHTAMTVFRLSAWLATVMPSLLKKEKHDGYRLKVSRQKLKDAWSHHDASSGKYWRIGENLVPHCLLLFSASQPVFLYCEVEPSNMITVTEDGLIRRIMGAETGISRKAAKVCALPIVWKIFISVDERWPQTYVTERSGSLNDCYARQSPKVGRCEACDDIEQDLQAVDRKESKIGALDKCFSPCTSSNVKDKGALYNFLNFLLQIF